MHARLFYGSSSIKTEGNPSDVVELKDAESSLPADLPTVKASEENHRKTEDPDDIYLVFSTFQEARTHGLGFGSDFRAKTSKKDKEWRYYCKVVSCSAKWRINEKNFTGKSMLFVSFFHPYVVMNP